MARKYEVIQDPFNGNRWQARFKDDQLPWADVGEGKETRAEAWALVTESMEYRKRVAEGREPTAEIEGD